MNENKNLVKQEFKIKGMHCASCVTVIEKSLKKNQGVIEAIVNLANENVVVSYTPDLIDENKIIKSIEQSGYKVVKAKVEKDETDELKRKLIISLILTLPVFILSMILKHDFMPYQGFVMFILATFVQFFIGWEFYRNAFYALKDFSANMDTLVAMGTTAAYFYSIYLLFWTQAHHFYFETSSVLITVIILGRYLEKKAKKKTGDAIRKLIDFSPKTAVVFKDRREEIIPVENIEAGDIVVIKPGEKIPADGTVVEGNSFVDESAVTGEPIPVEKKYGDIVISGSVNQHGSFKFRAERVGKDTVLQRIIRLIQEVQNTKIPVQKMVDTISSYFVPVVIIIAVSTFLIRFYFLNNELSISIMAAVSVLVIACPCALGLATPVAVVAGTGIAAGNGILFRNPEVIEITGKIRNLIVDKTGTITKGKPEVIDVVPFSGDMDSKEILKVTASLENNSEHPLAKAIMVQNKNGIYKTDNFRSFPGYGVQGTIENKKYYAGNTEFIEKKGINTDFCKERLDEFQNKGLTTILLADENKIFGVIATGDKLKDDSKQAIELLTKENINIYLVTGDNKKAAEKIAEEAGIKNIYSEVLPDNKVKIVGALKRYGITGFVGDGINDAPAIAQADVGFVMAAGSDISTEAGDIVLMKNSIKDIYGAIILSRKILSKIKQNLFWAFFYNVIGIPVAALGLLNPMVAGAAMALSSVSVVLNSLLLNKKI